MTKVIRVGLIGLSSDTSIGTNWAARAHLPYLLQSPKYEIVALQNSSAEKAKQAAEKHKLPGNVKSYGTPEEIANDPNIDLIVSSVRVDSHGSSVIPSIIQGKDVFVEWPLEANLSKATEMSELAKKHQVRNIAGLQGRFNPNVQKLKNIISSGKISRIISSDFTAYATIYGPTGMKTVSYFADRDVGGNMLTIPFGHIIEYITEVLGSIKSVKSLLATEHPVIDILDKDGVVVEKGRKRTSHDQALISVSLDSGAVLSYRLRGGPNFPGAPGLEWRIQGLTGEIRITSDQYFLNIGSGNLKIDIADYSSGKIESVELEKENFLNLPPQAQSIAAIYEHVWDEQFGEKGEREYRDFEHALKWHKLIDEMYKEYDAEHK